jgi:hypothetical protein
MGQTPRQLAATDAMSPVEGHRSGLGSRWLTIGAGIACAAFALKALLLIDRTSLWGDELRSVIKAFQPSLPFILDYLRDDSHPPLYYLSLWGWGQAIGHTAVSLRLFSWLAYLAGGLLITAQAAGLARCHARAACLAALMAFCTPFPLRFSIEGKGYALLTALVALALLARSLLLRSQWPSRLAHPGYGLSVALASLTHFYGLGLMGALAFWDATRGRWRLAAAAALGTLPAFGWILYASEYLFGPSTNSWIEPPELSLLSNTLTLAIGEDPLWKLLAVGLVVLVLQLWAGAGSSPGSLAARSGSGVEGREVLRLLDRSGVGAAVLLVAFVLAVSFLKPIAFSRYFVVLVPVLIPPLAVAAAEWRLRPGGEWVAVLLIAVALVHFWGASFAELDPGKGRDDREREDFRSLSLRLRDEPWRYARRPELLEASDRVLTAAGDLKGPVSPWGEEEDLRRDLRRGSPPERIILATAGRGSDAKERLRDLRAIGEAAGYLCSPLEDLPKGARAWRCLPQR